MPRSRSRKKRGGRDSRQPRLNDSVVLLELLDLLQAEDPGEGDFLLADAFDRAAWSFHAGPGPSYAGTESLARSRARLRAREWFLFECELPSGMTPVEEWIFEHEGQPGSAGVRRAATRLLQGECGIFEVQQVRPDGWLRLIPLPEGDPLLARPIDLGGRMLPGFDEDLPPFAAGETIAGRLYWRDEERAELSAGTDRISTQAKTRLLADPPTPQELSSGLAVEAFFGADAGVLLPLAGHPCYPAVVDELLSVISDGSFEYRRLWSELEGEPDPVGVTRQLLAELTPWTSVEPELLACGVAGAWLRRREAAAGRATTAATVARERRTIEEHVRTVLDVPADPATPVPPAGSGVHLARGAAADFDQLEAEDVEWIVDIRPDDWSGGGALGFSSSPYPLACAIVEQPIAPLGDLEDGAPDEEEGDGDEEDLDEIDLDDIDMDEIDLDEEDLLGEDLDEDEGDEGGWDAEDDAGPLLVHSKAIARGEDEAEVALDALVEAMLADENVMRPRRIAFRQRRVAARLGETLREAGFEVVLSYLSEAVDLATLDAELDEEARQAEARGERAQDGEFVPDDLAAYERLMDAARKSRDELEFVSSMAREAKASPLAVTLAQPLPFAFTTLEGDADRVASFLVGAEDGPGHVVVRIRFAPPASEGALDCRGASGEPLFVSADSVAIQIEADDEDEPPEAGLLEADERGATGGPSLMPIRYRQGAPPAFLRGHDLNVMAAVMEAVAALVEQGADAGWAEPFAADLRVDPLGDLKVEWRGVRS